ncbi:AMP-binding enzyme [Micromonospora schwarzwaldensis]|uniref:AMP-binding enzyme n=1 Tax=Micromonospora sp. DSM 45708 TaxID=3111767 RepID=UPI0031DD48CF
MIVRGGFDVYPREVEEVLAGHPAVGQVAVIGVPDPRHGEEVCAVVVADPPTVLTDRVPTAEAVSSDAGR